MIPMRKYIFALSFILLCTYSYSQQGEIQKIKLSHKDSVRLKQLPELEYPAYYLYNKTTLPATVDNSQQPYWRGIFWQSGCSCGQASSEGYVYTYEIDRVRDLDASLDENRYPYSFTYNFLNIGNTVCGASFLESQDIIREAGIPNVVTNNNQMTDYQLKRWLSGYDKYYSAMQNRIDNVYAIHVGTPEGLDKLKHWLNDHLEGSPVGGLAFFYANHVHDPDTVPAGTPEGGKHIITGFSNTSHAMTIVGYNDSVRFDYNHDGQYTNDIDITGDGIVDMRDWEIGALKIANSYNGSSSPLVWADQGFCYVMYRILAYHNSAGGFWDKAAYVTKVKEHYSPLLTAKVNLTYNSRDKLKIMAGVSTDLSSTTPQHLKEYPMFRYQGDALYMQGGTDEADKTIEFGLDLSELLNYVDSNQQARFFLYINEKDPNNEGSGTINSFSVIDYTNSAQEYQSSQQNITITNNGNTILYADAQVHHSKIHITSDTIPHAELNSPYSYQLEAEGGTMPRKWLPFYNYKITEVSNTFTPVSGTDLGYRETMDIDFEFPFYGKRYTKLTVSNYGAVMFENEDPNVPYDRDYSVLFRYFKSIAPFYGYSSSASITYSGDANHASFYWQADFNGQSYEYMVTLFPNGKIFIDYGNNPATTNSPEWSAGVSCGDQISYQEFDFSSQTVPSNTRIILEPRPFPEGLHINNSGLLYGTLTNEFSGDSIFVKVIDNNWISDIKGFLFTNRGLLFSNHQLSTPDDNLPEYDENALLSVDLINVGQTSINNLDIKLRSLDTMCTVIDSTASISFINAGETASLTDSFSFHISPYVPDNSLIQFTLQVNSDETYAADTFSFVARAPVVDVVNVSYTDTSDNVFDPGDFGMLHISYKNTGGSEVENIIFNISTSDQYLTIDSVVNDTAVVLLPDSIHIVNLYVHADSLTPEGYIAQMQSLINADHFYTKTESINVGIGLIIENWENGTNSFPWGFMGDADWYLDTNTVFEGNYALRSGQITHNQESVLSLTGAVTTSGHISFYKKISSEINYDFLQFYIDSILISQWSGEVDWQEHSFPVSSGIHTFKWVYVKDGSVSNGDDAAWIDHIILPPLDFSEPDLEINPLSFEKFMSPDEISYDTLFVANIGGGLLNYSVTIQGGTISSLNTSHNINNDNVDKSISGSYLQAVPDSFITGMPIALSFNLFNGSTDSEWLKDLTISFPLGVVLDSATAFTGASGSMAWDGNHGNGSDVNWHGEDNNGWGVVHGNETATATFYLRIDTAISNSVILQYTIDGDIYGSEPHSITDFVVLSNSGQNTTWLTIEDGNSGNVVANQNASVVLKYNTYGIPVGTYNCSLTINTSIDTVSVPVTLHVVDVTGNNIVDALNISIYPNPANDYFYISGEDIYFVEVYNSVGELIMEKDVNSNKTLVDIKNLTAGLYQLRIKTNKGIVYDKIVIY